MFPWPCLCTLAFSSLLSDFPAVHRTFPRSSACYPSGDGKKPFLLQFLVQLPHQFVGVGLGDTQRLGYFLGPYKQLFAQIQHLLIVGSQNC